jgi:hypothetical protein
MGMKSDAVAVTLISLATTYRCSEEFGKAMKSPESVQDLYRSYSSEKSTTLNPWLYETWTSQWSLHRVPRCLAVCKINLGKDHLRVGEMYCTSLATVSD